MAKTAYEISIRVKGSKKLTTYVRIGKKVRKDHPIRITINEYLEKRPDITRHIRSSKFSDFYKIDGNHIGYMRNSMKEKISTLFNVFDKKEEK